MRADNAEETLSEMGTWVHLTAPELLRDLRKKEMPVPWSKFFVRKSLVFPSEKTKEQSWISSNPGQQFKNSFPITKINSATGSFSATTDKERSKSLMNHQRRAQHPETITEHLRKAKNQQPGSPIH